MGELRLSEHFCEQWMCYFNERPTISKILRIITRSKWLQRGRLLFDHEGVPFKQLATYWHPERKVVIKVDWTQNKVVTVITPKTQERRLRALREEAPDSERAE